MICRVSATHKLPKGSFIRRGEPYSHSGEERKTRLRVCIFDGESVKSAFALLLTKVTKPPYPVNISFYTIAGKDTNLCAMSGTGFRKRGEEYDDETNNQWYDRDRVSGS